MLLTQNAKMRKASLKTYDFALPAGDKTCIGASTCLNYCYATRGFYKMPTVKAKHAFNHECSKLDSFHQMINGEIATLKLKGLEAIRIHSAGDFYSREYLHKWLKIITDNPSIDFYAYTKSIPLFINAPIPFNFKVVYSTGGKHDHLIEKHGLRSCKVVDNYSYANDSSDDDDSIILFSEKPIELLKRKVH